MDALTIGKVAGLTQVGVETIRFYERQGLIDQPPRKPSGYRQYPPDTVDRVRFVKRAKQLGFTLKEIKELLSLRIDPDSTCGDIRRRALIKIGDIESRVQTLQRMKQALKELTLACDGQGSVSECPILEALEDKSP